MPALPAKKKVAFIPDHSLVVQSVMREELWKKDWERDGHRECWMLVLFSLVPFLVNEFSVPETGAAHCRNGSFHLS